MTIIRIKPSSISSSILLIPIDFIIIEYIVELVYEWAFIEISTHFLLVTYLSSFYEYGHLNKGIWNKRVSAAITKLKTRKGFRYDRFLV